MSVKILVVDDIQDTRELLYLCLSHEGYSVIEAANGREGFDRAKAERPDLVVTDLSMPVMDGLTMIRELRANAGTAELPIIALTCYGPEKLASAKQAGANKACSKPMNLADLVDLVGGLLVHKNP